MTQKKHTYELQPLDAREPAPVLRGVECHSRLDGVLFESTLRQRYRNDSDRNLEVVYTFPKAVRAVLLGFASELNGARMEGAIVLKRDAETSYEGALADGDAPVMLEQGGNGLCTANVGNLKPGDELVIEVRTAEMLQFEHGRLRLALPTAIAPRYGSPLTAGLQPQQVPVSSPLADYPLSLTVEIRGALADAAIECRTHRMSRELTGGALRLKLNPGARLDRDVVVTVQPRVAGTSLLCHATDPHAPDAPCVLMAAFVPRRPQRRESIDLKVLVDCSSSMSGDSIDSARKALSRLVQDLGDKDTISISRFGSHLEHSLPPTAVSPVLRRSALEIVQRLNADLGGTEMEQALCSVFQLTSPSKVPSTDVLIVTDGEIWQAESVLKTAQASGHRIFAIGVGSSPAEEVLRGLAEASGGACEFATPGELLEAAAARMLDRIRQLPAPLHSIDWGSKPIWQTAMPMNAFDGDTLTVFAGFPQPPGSKFARLLAQDGSERLCELASCESSASNPGPDSLVRMAAACRMHAVDDVTAKSLALRYQLMSRYTNCIMVHERAGTDKATQAAELQQIVGMHPAGAAGYGSATRHMSFDCEFDLDSVLPAAPSPAGAAFSKRNFPSDLMSGCIAELVPQFEYAGDASLKSLAEAVRVFLSATQGIDGLAEHVGAKVLHPDVQRALDEMVRMGLSRDQAWLALARWVYARTSHAPLDLPRFAPLADPALEQAVALQLELSLGAYNIDDWTTARQARLARATAALRR
jgi:Ca-activated chloride channel family protein